MRMPIFVILGASALLMAAGFTVSACSSSSGSDDNSGSPTTNTDSTSVTCDSAKSAFLCDIEEGIPLAGNATSTTCKACLINNCSDEALACANASTNTCKTEATGLLTCLQNNGANAASKCKLEALGAEAGAPDLVVCAEDNCDADCSITAMTNQ